MVDVRPAPSESENPFLPPGPAPLSFDTFTTLNTNASRPGIADQEMFWCDGFMPVGKSFLRTLYGVGDAAYTASSGLTVVAFGFANIGATPIMVVFLSDGSIQQVNTNTSAVTQIAPAGTILNPSIPNIGMTQWGNQYVVVGAAQTNGFWIWDGTNFYATGTLGPDVNLVNNGLDYTSQPTITAYGGTGSGATFNAQLDDGIVQQVFVTDPGSGYGLTDGVVLVFSGGGSAGKTATGYGVVTNGSITGISIVSGGAGYTSAATATLIGGGGAGATCTVTQSGGAINGGTVTDGGAGYTSSPTLFVVDANNPVAQASVDLMPSGISGTSLETYTSRLFIKDQARVSFTAPESVVDFATSDGGGFFESHDSFLRVQFVALKQTNGFLYLIADSSVNYISGINTSGSPPSTTFTNQNADPEIGASWAPTVQVFSRNIVFGNPFGIHVSYGGAVSKISENLDGFYNSVPNFGNFTPSSAKAIIFGKKVYMMLMPIIDQVSGQQVNKLIMWNGKSFWTSGQDIPLIFVACQEINSVLTAWGTDGNAIYPLFQKPSTAFTKTVQSKLWANPGSYQLVKTANRLWGLANYYSSDAADLEISIDNEIGQSTQIVTVGPNEASWINASGDSVVWTNVLGVTVVWLISGTGIVVFPPQGIGQAGALIGLTVKTEAADMALISLMVQTEIMSYRG